MKREYIISGLVAVAIFLIGQTCGLIAGRAALAEQKDTTFIEKSRHYSKLDLKPAKEYTLNYRFRGSTKMVFLEFSQLDTVTIHDTTYIAAPREFREYRGNDYFALVSGIDPTLDSLSFRSRDMIIEPRPKFKKNTISIYANPIWMNHIHIPVGLSYERYFTEYMAIGGAAGYDFATNKPFLSASARIRFGW